jgi:hypothetical protein
MRSKAAPCARAPALAGALALLACGAGAARADWDGYEEHRVPIEPPLALPQSINGTVRRSAKPVKVDRIDRILDVFIAIRGCWRAPDGEARGLETTMKVAFKRGGEVLDRPRITYMSRTQRQEDREGFIDSAFSAFASCAPLPFTPGFGSAIAGRPFTFRFIDDRKS